MNKKIQEWHNAVVQGMVNGLTHTDMDERRDDINWVRKRLGLWEAFGRCVFAYHNDQNWEYDEKDLFEIAKEGYYENKPNRNNGTIMRSMTPHGFAKAFFEANKDKNVPCTNEKSEKHRVQNTTPNLKMESQDE